MPVPDQLRYLVADHADEPAYRLVEPGGTVAGELTFRAWDETASRVGHALVDRGLEQGDVVGVLFDQPDALTHVQAYVGVHKAGGVHVPVNTKFSPTEIAAVLQHAEPRVLFVSQHLLTTVDAIRDDLKSVELVVASGEGDADAVAWRSFLADDTDDLQVDVSDDDMSDILYTSGTTGAPKGVVIRHRNALSIESGAPDWNGMSWFHASPMFTTAGLSFVYVPMRLGMTATYMSRFDAETFVRLAEEARIQTAFLVPAMVEMILALPDIEEHDLSGMLMISVGGAPVAPATLNRLNALAPNATVSNSFGMTEAGSGHLTLPPGELERRPGSVGKALPPVEIMIVDPRTNEEVPIGEVGEITMLNPGQQREYYEDPEATAETWRDGWLHTGDLGYLDEDGYLYISGRMKDVIIRGGHNVHALDVEAVLYEHEAVREAAAVGLPHDVLGEEVAAVVVLHEGAEVSEDGLREFCRGRLAGYAYPRVVAFVDELPRNATGKVLKQELRDALTSG